MDRCDVLIVGGGPAGSTSARCLVRAGLDVAVLDKAGFPRDKVCTGWITPAVVRTLDLDLTDYGAGRTLQPFTGFRTGPMDGGLIVTDFHETVSHGIRRCEFDDYLLRRSGAGRIAWTLAHARLAHDHRIPRLAGLTGPHPAVPARRRLPAFTPDVVCAEGHHWSNVMRMRVL